MLPFPFVPFPLLKSLYFCVLPSLCPLFCSILLREWTLSSFIITPLGLWDLLPLASSGSPSRVMSGSQRGLPHTMQTLVQQALPERGFMRVIAVLTSSRVVDGSPIIPTVSPLFFCHQEKFHWEWVEVAILYILCMRGWESPPVGCSPTEDMKLSGFQTSSAQWAVGRLLPPSLAPSANEVEIVRQSV